MTANIKEGARRIKVVGQLTALAGAIIMAVFFILPSYRTFIAYLFVSLYLLIMPIIAGSALWAIGWILEGFARSK